MGSINPSYSNYYCWLVMNLQWKRVSNGLPSRLQEVLEISWNRHTKHPRPPLNLSIRWTVLWYWAAESCWLFCIEEKGYRETCIRNGNMVFGQRNCVTTRVWSTLFCIDSTMICTASCLHEHGRWSVSVIGLNMCLFQFVLIYLFFDLKYIAVALFLCNLAQIKI